MRLSLLPPTLAIFQSPLPVSPAGSFFSSTITSNEASYVMEAPLVPPSATAVNTGWRALMVDGPLDFSLTGILSSIAAPLASARVSIFAVSTFSTDYVLVKEDTLAAALAALRAAGHEVSES